MCVARARQSMLTPQKFPLTSSELKGSSPSLWVVDFGSNRSGFFIKNSHA